MAAKIAIRAIVIVAPGETPPAILMRIGIEIPVRVLILDVAEVVENLVMITAVDADQIVVALFFFLRPHIAVAGHIDEAHVWVVAFQVHHGVQINLRVIEVDMGHSVAPGPNDHVAGDDDANDDQQIIPLPDDSSGDDDDEDCCGR